MAKWCFRLIDDVSHWLVQCGWWLNIGLCFQIINYVSFTTKKPILSTIPDQQQVSLNPVHNQHGLITRYESF